MCSGSWLSLWTDLVVMSRNDFLRSEMTYLQTWWWGKQNWCIYLTRIHSYRRRRSIPSPQPWTYKSDIPRYAYLRLNLTDSITSMGTNWGLDPFHYRFCLFWILKCVHKAIVDRESKRLAHRMEEAVHRLPVIMKTSPPNCQPSLEVSRICKRGLDTVTGTQNSRNDLAVSFPELKSFLPSSTYRPSMSISHGWTRMGLDAYFTEQSGRESFY